MSLCNIFHSAYILLAAVFSVHSGLAQDKVRKLPPNINQPSINLYAPFVSGDGQTIVYLSDYTDNGHHGMRWTTKKTVSTWNDELEVNRLINRPTLNYRGGYSLTFDGDMLLFTSRKFGIGGFDLWYSQRRGNDWGAPVNFGMPVNSRGHDGAPVISPDGAYLYFMRCDQMSEYGGASGCRILVAKRSYNGWEEPRELPENINTGNSQTPRILADGETLVFASDQFGGKGGLDLFMTTRKKEGWTDPVPMDFINTEKDDQFISIPAKGRYLYADVQGERDRDLVQILIPEEFQPKDVMRIQGTVTDALTGEPLNANLTVFNIGERDRLWNEKTGKKGEFAIVLKEGAAYDLAVDVDDPYYMFFSKVYDFTDEIGARDKEKLNIRLSPVQQYAVYATDILFKENSADLSDKATFELRRIAALLKKIPTMKIELTVHQRNYREDSVQRDPDLTELTIDSIYTQVKLPIPVADTLKLDSAAVVTFDSLGMVKKDSADISDTTALATVQIDSLETGSEKEYTQPARDTLSPAKIRYEIIKQLELKYTYHNDRTEKQAAAIEAYLEGRGIDGDRIKLKTERSHSKKSMPDAPTKETEDVVVTLKVITM